MSPHPPSYKLEGHAAGDHDPEVAEHAKSCEPCRLYLEQSIAGASEWARMGASPIRALLTQPLPKRAPRVVRLMRVATFAVPLAAAAALAIFVGHFDPQKPHEHGEEVAQGGARFKGALQIAVVREREGVQERFKSVVPIRAGDKLRVEVAVDGTYSVTGGVLDEDGAWLPVLDARERSAGKYLSDRAAEIDAYPSNGIVVVGEPGAVDRARASRDFSAVSVIRIQPES
jgi:hypothetical protein